jgi:hypothetical protein
MYAGRCSASQFGQATRYFFLIDLAVLLTLVAVLGHWRLQEHRPAARLERQQATDCWKYLSSAAFLKDSELPLGYSLGLNRLHQQSSLRLPLELRSGISGLCRRGV